MHFCFISYFLCNSICPRDLLAKSLAFLCALRREAGGTRALTRVWKDRNRKETNTRNKNLLRMPFRVLSCQPPTGDRGKKTKNKNKNPLISMMIFLSSVTGNFSADTLTFTICQTQRSAPMFSVQPGVSCFITNSKCTHVFAICAIYAHRLKSPKS